MGLLGTPPPLPRSASRTHAVNYTDKGKHEPARAERKSQSRRRDLRALLSALLFHLPTSILLLLRVCTLFLLLSLSLSLFLSLGEDSRIPGAATFSLSPGLRELIPSPMYLYICI